LAVQMLPLWEAEGTSTARIACGRAGTSRGAVQTFLTNAELQHRTCPVQIKSDHYTTDLASAEGNIMFKSVIYCTIQVRRNQEGNCYVFLRCIVYRYTGKFLAYYSGSSKGRVSIVEKENWQH